MKRVKSKILLDKEYNAILMEVFENGRTCKEDLFEKFKSQKSKVQELVKNRILKSSEVKDMLIIDTEKLLQ